MNQNSTDNDLQKAIDDITNTTNRDPIFADPVAAPSSVPEGDTGELAESIGPFPTPKPMPTPPQPIATFATSDFSVQSLQSAPLPDPIQETPRVPEPLPEPSPRPGEPSETIVATETTTFTGPTPAGLSIREIKTAALRDLAPLVGKMDLSASQKFNIYRDMFENLRDYTVIEQAYQAAKDIMDEKERAEALLYLVQAIDNM